jgi:serine/threonine protein kinase
MNHPNIAKVFDAGASDTGRPYFVMELVQGVSITDYCDKNKLDTRQRLELLVQVCHAVQHAHQKGIIHRDIKPSNVLVTIHDDKPVPKIIDFGVAKATNQRLMEKTVFTRYAHFIGTPAYMSPEQAQMSGLDVDTRSDIYSLGVLIYELLTGTTPFDADKLREVGYTEIQRIICETDPLKPSTKLGTLGQTLTSVAQYRQVNPDSLRKLLKGDLDWIVMKSLEKDRSRRYETAHALAEDIERHLKNEPILAHSPSLVYRAQKFWRRHRSHINTAAIIMVLLSALVVTVVMYRRASNLRWAKGEALPEVVELVKEGNYVEAFSLAQKARKYIPQDETCGLASAKTTQLLQLLSGRVYSVVNML